MDLTQGTRKDKIDRAKKMMLWFGIVSLIMGFAGWTSAYIVSSSRKDWIRDLQLPQAFFISAGIIVLSSLTYILAKKAIMEGRHSTGTNLLWATLALGGAFIFYQFQGFSQMVSQGYYFTGPTSNIKLSYIFLIAAVHIAHVVAGIISLSIVIYNQVKGKYSPEEYLGVSLGATFWHFLDILWIYLLGFMYFVG